MENENNIKKNDDLTKEDDLKNEDDIKNDVDPKNRGEQDLDLKCSAWKDFDSLLPT